MAATAIATPAAAQTLGRNGELSRPDYGSAPQSAFLSNTDFNTPESDGRPGVKFYKEGMAAYHRGDIEHAIYMLKLAAYWAYAPAAYNLGVMYFQGEGDVPVNRPLGTAWMFIAAERGAADYVNARHMLVSQLGYAERTKALELLQQLQPKYGDETALRRAKAHWAFAKSNQTGTRVGGTVGELRVGISAGRGSFRTPMGDNAGGGAGTYSSSWMDVLSGGSVDGDMAYQQFHQSENPYDPVFLKHRSGIVSVESLQQVKSAHDKAKQNDREDSLGPDQPLHNG
ncbi:MAG TPA: sel1 repeat family protein [Rhodanobacteraceae bacterium]|nr:sel1 repeat family protein [Rhodanobacteraceae bacterium]